ncbi:glycine--tRNA ligase, partial [Candidatus Dojkabacteria bacterium]|nr:glycine--tRNA ligase [Candidatus Dojkabacteria bacterium]
MHNTQVTLEKITSWAKRRGFIYPSSEIYGGLAGVYDYGHYGVLLKNNIQQAWWKAMVFDRDDMVGLDSAIFMHPTTWKASGHVDSFSDPQIDCRTCKHRMRADHYLEKFGYDVDRWPLGEVNALLAKLKEEGKLKCEKCGNSDLTEARDFNLLVKTNFGSPIGRLQDLPDEDVVYPRGETCQGIYLNYKNVVDSMRVKLPFGIAQVGKAFRNEIVTKQYTFR